MASLIIDDRRARFRWLVRHESVVLGYSSRMVVTRTEFE